MAGRGRAREPKGRQIFCRTHVGAVPAGVRDIRPRVPYTFVPRPPAAAGRVPNLRVKRALNVPGCFLFWWLIGDRQSVREVQSPSENSCWRRLA